jgi:hypothetical protein
MEGDQTLVAGFARAVRVVQSNRREGGVSKLPGRAKMVDVSISPFE